MMKYETHIGYQLLLKAGMPLEIKHYGGASWMIPDPQGCGRITDSMPDRFIRDILTMHARRWLEATHYSVNIESVCFGEADSISGDITLTGFGSETSLGDQHVGEYEHSKGTDLFDAICEAVNHG